MCPCQCRHVCVKRHRTCSRVAGLRVHAHPRINAAAYRRANRRRGSRGGSTSEASRPGSGFCSRNRKPHFWRLELALTVRGLQ